MKDTEFKKTLMFVLAAGMAVLVAWEPWRPAPANNVPERVGQKLFPDFENPLAAKSLEIVTFNEANATIRDFKVAQSNGVWSIPSHSGYPADATEHMAKAATALMDIKILSVASDRPGDQKTYGVIAPDPKELKVGMTGVGTQVIVRDGADKVLANLIIGKPVKDAPQQRYVREAGRDAIYIVALNTSEFSTKFGDWIEKDLLKLNAFDVRQIELNDYSTRSGVTREGQFGLALEKRSEIELAFDDAKSEWSLVEMKEFDPQGNATVVSLAENEQLNTEKLNAMKTALDDLQIVDVERKPAGLSQDLRATEEFAKNREAFISLQQRGFVPAAAPGEPVQIYSSEGEVTCATKDGVKYILRFGNLADTGGESGDDGNSDDDKDDDAPKGPSRYLFVTAQFDESMIPKPELKPLPGEAKAADEAAGDKPAEEKPAEESDEEKPAEENAASEEKPAEDSESKPAESTDEAENKPAEEPAPETKTAAQEDEAEQPEEKPATEEKPAEDKPAAEGKSGDDKPAEEKPAEKAEEKPLTQAEAERLAVEKENKRLMDEYNEKIKAGQEKVKQLNDRFADWYYIISDDVYKKIHLGRNDIIEPKPTDTKDLGNLKQLEGGLGTPAVP